MAKIAMDRKYVAYKQCFRVLLCSVTPSWGTPYMFQPNLHLGIMISFYFRADVRKQNSLHVKKQEEKKTWTVVALLRSLKLFSQEGMDKKGPAIESAAGQHEWRMGTALVFRHSLWFKEVCIVCCILISRNDLTSEHVIVCHGNLL